MKALQRIDCAKVVELIAVDYLFGDGTESNPVRRVTQYWDLNGNLMAVSDPLNDNRELYTSVGKLLCNGTATTS